MLTLAPEQQSPKFECDYTLKQFTTRFKEIGLEVSIENESVKLAGKPQLISGGDHPMCMIRPQYHACIIIKYVYICMHDN